MGGFVKRLATAILSLGLIFGGGMLLSSCESNISEENLSSEEKSDSREEGGGTITLPEDEF